MVHNVYSYKLTLTHVYLVSTNSSEMNFFLLIDVSQQLKKLVTPAKTYQKFFERYMFTYALLVAYQCFIMKLPC